MKILRVLQLTLGILAATGSAVFAQTSIPAGTTVVVRTIDAIDSKSAEAGKTFRASLDEPLNVNGNTVARKGADVALKVVETRSAGKMKGKAELTIAIATVNVGTEMVPVDTETVTMEGKSKGKQSALKVFGGAALGAGIGAVAGGGKGAAIGAGAGAAAGTAMAVTTGPQVKIPSETRLTFTAR